nr:hypothetical protein [uncultured Acetatifactor sp.]
MGFHDGDTRLLGPRGFAQTDQRADIYALGVTLEQLMGDNIRKPRYQKAVRKCRNLDPDKRYQSMRQMRLAFFTEQWAAALILAAVLGLCATAQPVLRDGQRAEDLDGGAGLAVLPAPGNPHWDGETGNVVWDNVPESGVGDAVHFRLRLYRKDAASAPVPEDGGWYDEELVRFGGSGGKEAEAITWNAVPTWSKSKIVEKDCGGISIPPQFLSSEPGGKYRFTAQVYSSRTNEYASSPMPEPAPEE